MFMHNAYTGVGATLCWGWSKIPRVQDTFISPRWLKFFPSSRKLVFRRNVICKIFPSSVFAYRGYRFRIESVMSIRYRQISFISQRNRYPFDDTPCSMLFILIFLSFDLRQRDVTSYIVPVTSYRFLRIHIYLTNISLLEILVWKMCHVSLKQFCKRCWKL